MGLEVGQEVLADDINKLKQRVKAEIKRRQKDDSLKNYNSTNYDYTVVPDKTKNTELLTEHYNKIAPPILAINNKSKNVTTAVTLPTTVNQNDLVESISLLEKLLTDFEGQKEYAATDCQSACTGFCTSTCTETCKGGCEENCANVCKGACGAACAANCTGTCSGGCGGGCGGGCSDGCGGNCSGTCTGSCSGGCSGSCTGCSSTCTGGCSQSYCKGSCLDTCVNFCKTGCLHSSK